MNDNNEVYENGQGISEFDGVLLKRGPASLLKEIVHSTTGTLSLVHYLSNKLCIEWKANDHYLIADADTQDDWSFVDTITKRNRTSSECAVFGSPPNATTQAKEINNAERQQSPSQTTKSNCLRVRIVDLKNIDVLKNGHIIRLISNADNKVHSEYFFQNGNAEGFVRTLQTVHCLQRSRQNKNQFEIVDNIEYDKEKLQKTFAELKIDDIKAGKRGWLPFSIEHTIDFFAKVSDYTSMAGQSVQTSPVKSNQNSSTSLISNEYEVLSTSPKPQNPNISILPPRPNVIRGSPLSEKQWKEFMTEDGRISDAERVKEIIFRGGIEESLRYDVWKFLLGYFEWDMTAEQRIQHQNRQSQVYYQMKLQWLSMSQIQEKNFGDYRERKCQIEKDVKRTDRTLEYFAGDDSTGLEILKDILMTYVMFNFDLGYVQGMSDLLAPILCIMKNESDAFWCFKGFMDLVDRNFDLDQTGMKGQLQDLNKLLAIANPRLYNYFTEHKSENMYFCFRWLLVWFKREFTVEDICELWEVLWTGLPCINFHLFVSVAILDDQQNTFIDQKYEFNEILKHVNDLSLAIDLKSTLEKAEAIYLQIKVTEHLTDEIRLIIGEEPIRRTEIVEEEYDDNFDEIVTISKNAKEEIEIQKKIDEACERSMYNSFY